MHSHTVAAYPSWTAEWRLRLLAALAVLILAIQPLLTIFPPDLVQRRTRPAAQAEPAALNAPQPTALQPVSAPIVPAPAPYPLPAELVGKPELPTLRTLDTATFDMGDGTFAVLQDAAPLHYQDADGQWQRIDPTFVAEPQGWTNYRNVLHTAIATGSSEARITTQSLGVTWQPQALEVVAADGQRDPVAALLPSTPERMGVAVEGGRSVRFPSSWSLSGVQDQWQAGPGRVEYSMALPALPESELPAPAGLDLRVTLRLLAGTQLTVDGQPAALPLETSGPLSFVAADGSEVHLLPPHTYEMNRREEGTDALYLLDSTGEPDEVSLTVRTPWSWLAAPGRQFPVVIDPMFQVRAATEIAHARYDPLTACNTFTDIVRGASTNWLGRSENHCNRLLVRFGIPVLPAGSAISRAWLLVAPTTAKGKYGSAGGNVSVHRVNNVSTRAWWLPLGPGDQEVAPAYDAPLPQDPQFMFMVKDGKTHPILKWDVTSAVNSWLYTVSTGTETLFEKNGGLILRTNNEACLWGLTFDMFCGAMGFQQPAGNWADGASETAHSDSADALLATPGTESGVRLVVFYTGPTLAEGQTVTVNPMGAGGMPPGGYPYYQVDRVGEVSSDGMSHIYNLPATPAYWQAAAVRGFGATTTTEQTGYDAKKYPVSKTPRAGAYPLALLAQGGTEDALIWFRETASNGVSWLLRNGRGAPPGINEPRQLRVGGNPNNAVSSGYDIRLLKEKATLQTTVVATKTETIAFYDTRDPLMLWNLNLPQGTNTEIKVQFGNFSPLLDGDNLDVLDFYDLDEQFRAFVVQGSRQLDLAGSDLYKSEQIPGDTPGYTQMVYNSPGGIIVNPSYNSLYSADLQNVPAGQHALVLSYTGPSVRVSGYIPPPNAAGMGDLVPAATDDTVQIGLFFKVTVTSCAAGSFPDASGNCRKVTCPNPATFPAANKPQVGDLRLWSANGWNAINANSASSKPGEFAPLVGKADGSLPTVAIIGDLTYDLAPNPDTITSTSGAKAVLINCTGGAQPSQSFVVAKGKWARSDFGGKSVLTQAPFGDFTMLRNPWAQDDRQDLLSFGFRVMPIDAKAEAQSELRRILDNDAGGTVDLRFPVTWNWTAAGWPSLGYTIAAKPGNPAPPEIASMILTLGGSLDLDLDGPKPTDRFFRAVRAKNAVIAQKPQLGGASRPVQAVILGRNKPVPETNALCTASCIDLRGPTDSFAVLNRRWEMPDVHTDVAAGTVVMSAPGNLTVYSTDHPMLPAGADFATSYSFDAYQAEVSITKEKCLASDTKEVLVVRGATSMTIPGIGSGGSASIGAEFKLCDTALRETHMFFSSSVGIPIGTTGLFLTGLDGHVTITPTGTEIVVGIDFQASQGGDGGIVKVRGTVTINTAGLFAFQGKGTVLGILSAEGGIWVAWNPLDVGFEVELALEDWLRGYAYAHMWVGQGFGNKYTWLPDNNERHLAAEWGVTLSIESGDIVSFPPLPPGDIEIGFVAAFGQFCTNGGCTSYEWGVKGKFIVLGVDVGLYYGFDEGLDFILGNDDHILIDQYGGAFTATMAPANLQAANVLVPQVAPAAVDGTALIPFTVSAQAESFLISLAWQAGSPQFSLINPDGVEINAGNAGAHNAQMETGADFAIIGMQTPKPGAWKAKIANLSANGIEHYRLWYFANKGAPGTPGNRGSFTKPSQDQNASGITSIEWSVPPDVSDAATISLFSMRTQVITGNLESNVPIVQNLPFKAGRFDWNTATVRNGQYRIKAVVDDGVNDLPTGQVSIPADACVPLTTGLPQPRAFDPNRFPGTVVFTSTATIAINDTVAPAAPSGLSLKAGDSALLATWNAGGEKDLSNYLVRWGPRNGGGFQVKNQQLVQATKTPGLRIGAVDNGVEYGVDVTAVDFNGNASTVSAPAFATPNGLANPEPSTPISLTVTSVGSTSAGFSWSPGPGAVPASYRLTYVQLGSDAGPGEKNANGTNTTVDGLQTGAAYDVFAAAANSDGWFSPPSDVVRVVVTNGVDGNGDGMADDWAAAFGVDNANSDPDGDGLKNKDEQAAGSNPKVQDIDGDSFSDLEEVAGGFDAASSASYGAGIYLPRLNLSNDQVHFKAKRPNGAAPVQVVNWINEGGGNLALAASTQDAWIKPTVNGDKIEIAVDFTNNTAPGFYSGVVRLGSAQGSDPLIGDPACVRVNAWLLPADNEIPAVKQAQTIAFDTIPNKLLSEPPFQLKAAASSGLPVSFTGTTPSVCSLNGDMVTLVATGVCTIYASQAGNDQWAKAPDEFRSFIVSLESINQTVFLPVLHK